MINRYMPVLLLLALHTGFVRAGGASSTPVGSIIVEAEYLQGVISTLSFTIPNSIDIQATAHQDLLQCIDQDSLRRCRCIAPTFNSLTWLESMGVAALGGMSVVALKKVVERFSSDYGTARYVYGGAGILASVCSLWGVYCTFVRDGAKVYAGDIYLKSNRSLRSQEAFVGMVQTIKEGYSIDASRVHDPFAGQCYAISGQRMADFSDYGRRFVDHHSLTLELNEDYLKKRYREHVKAQGVKWMLGGALVAAPCLGALAHTVCKHSVENAPLLLN